ncbi:hypothetical protein [Streptomyces sp. NPDC047014]|uniref:hypothetical protein n=1 Tax=Streptomyces sp. NPDC047014 TaxID=3155736 RepID=UPI0033F6EDFC
MVAADRETLEALIKELAEALGDDLPSWRDGHARWDIYRRISLKAGAVDNLRRAVEIEPDAPIASAIVVMMLEHLDPSTRAEWVEMLHPSVRPFSAVRARELETLESLSAPSVPRVDKTALEGWSDWLQLRIVESVTDRRILSTMAEQGRTKRIRRVAAERLTGATDG